MRVEVAVALPDNQRVLEIELPTPATVADALVAAREAGLLGEFDVDDPAVGIYGELVDPSRELQEGDRVELYRPLQVDPKQARQRRAGSDKKPRRF